MDDLISRQAAIEAISASKMVYGGTWGKGLSMAVEKLRELPSAQPEIIRCKDCRHYDTHGHRCKFWNHGVADDGFCYKGEQE